jgi:hypothetical protein
MDVVFKNIETASGMIVLFRIPIRFNRSNPVSIRFNRSNPVSIRFNHSNPVSIRFNRSNPVSKAFEEEGRSGRAFKPLPEAPPVPETSSKVQSRITAEADKFGDIVQVRSA